MLPNFDMDALRTMVAGSELGSFARAAVRLGRSQSAVSMQLRKLEEQAGRPLFRRSGRGLVPTEAGEALLGYARRILALNDEAAAAVGAAAEPAAVRMGLPQDLFEDVMPAALAAFAARCPGVPVEVRAGRNHILEAELRAGRLDVALAFFRAGSQAGELAATLPMLWLAAPGFRRRGGPLPLVLFDHPCLFRQAGLQALDRAALPWRLALTTPSLPGVWAAVGTGQGVTVRADHNIPEGLAAGGRRLELPDLPPIELRLIAQAEPSPPAAVLREALAAAAADAMRRPG